MHTAPYLWMHIITLICNLLLYISYSSVKGEHTVDIFRGLLILYILCPLTSICQRLFLWPGPLFWFKVSQLVLLLLPMSIYYFLYAYVGKKPKLKDHVTVCTLESLLVVPSIFDIYLGKPELITLPENQIQISYNGDWKLAIPFAITSIIFGICLKLILENRHKREFLDINIGIISLILGNLILVLPGVVFPWDMLGCMINSLMLALALYRLKLLKFKLTLSFQSLVLMASITVSLGGIAVYNLVSAFMPVIDTALFVELWVVSTFTTMIIAFIYNWLSKRTSLVNSNHLLDTSQKYSEQMLADVDNQDQIIDNLKHAMQEAMGEVDALIYLYDEKTGCFAPSEDSGLPVVAMDTKLVDWVIKDQRVDQTSNMLWTLDIDMAPIRHEINRRKLYSIVPFISDGKLLGFMFFGTTNGRRLRSSVVNAIESLVLTTSMALQNVDIYRKLEYQLTEDSVTGLLNRATFDEYLDKALKNDDTHVLYIADLDDMKLYNQVYSPQMGDDAMKVFAGLMVELAPEETIMSRYVGKTFCLLFSVHMEKAIDFDRNLRRKWSLRNEGTSLSRIKFSSGIMVVDRNIARDSLEAVTLGRLAVKKAKRQGKNQMCLFTPDMLDDRELWETGFNVNAAEAISHAIDLKDSFTYNHSANVAFYARELAIDIGLSYYEQQLVYEAGLIHDVGKIAIPDRVLTKPGKLTDEEYELMKTHVESGHTIIAASAHGHLLYPLAETHHERWDGNGYPKGLKGTKIPVGGRCLAIADAFDAMTGRRIYKKAMSNEDAIAELERCKGKQFDPYLTDRFIALVKCGRINPEDHVMKA